MQLTTSEMADAMESLGTLVIRRAFEDKWSASLDNVEIGHEGLLSSCVEWGSDPNQAVSLLWDRITNLAPDERLVVGAYRPERGEYRWNGFMWKEVRNENRS